MEKWKICSGEIITESGRSTGLGLIDSCADYHANMITAAAAPELLAALEEVQKVMLQVSATMGNPAMAHLLPFGLRERVDELSFTGIGAVINRARGVSA